MTIPQRALWLLLLASTVWPIADKYNIEPKIVMAMIHVESSFRSDAINNGCYGLLQINFKTWEHELKLDKSRMLEIKYNVETGLYILNHYRKHSGDLFDALFHFNNGFKYKNFSYVSKIKKILEIRGVE